MDIFIKPSGSGDPVRLTRNSTDEVTPRWSPDGRYLAFLADPGAGGNVYLIPPLGGAERKLAETGIPSLEQHAQFVSALGAMPWSPDAQELLYTRSASAGQTAIWKVHLSTGEQSQVTFPPAGGSDTAASWSFDGERIAFVRVQQGRLAALWVAPSRGGDPRLLLGDRYRNIQPTWSPDSRRVVFASNRGGSQSLWEIDLATAGLRQLTTGVWEMAPAVARGGGLAYVQFTHQVNLHALQIETGEDEQLTAHSHENLFPSFAPDGRRFVYHSDRTGNGDIWLFDLETRTERQLTDHPAMDLVPDWSPDGQEIVFLSNREGKHQVWVMNAEGGGLRRLAEQTVPLAGGAHWPSRSQAPRWSPDGRAVGFVAESDQGKALWVADRDGRNARSLLHGLLYFDWYDSQRVIYLRRAGDGLPEMRAANLETGEEAVLLKEPAIELIVSPDGRSVAYSHALSHTGMNLFLLPLQPPASVSGLPQAAGAPRQLTDGRGQWHVHNGGWSPDSKTIVYTRDNDEGDIYVIENYR